MSTRRGVVDESKRTLEESVEPERASTLTMSHRRVEAESGESDRSDTSDTDWRCRGRVPEARTTSTKALESIEADRARWQATHISRGATYRFRKPLERSATRTTDSLIRTIIDSFNDTFWYISFDFTFSSIEQTLTG
jgi:hypothetical protein